MNTNKVSNDSLNRRTAGGNASVGEQFPPSKNRRANRSPQPAKQEGSQVRPRRGGGPRTTIGKERSKRNSTKYGIFAKEVLLPGERSSDFNRLLDGLRKDCKPKGILENLLVERLAEILWRRCRLIRAEKGEIRKASEFLEVDQERDQVNEAAVILEFVEDSRGIMRKISNPRILERCLAQLQKLKSCIEDRGFDETSDNGILTDLYGTSPNRAMTLIDWYSHCLSEARSNENVDEEGELPTPEDCKAVFLRFLDEEIKRLKRLAKEQSMIDSKRTKVELLCRNVPEGPELERLLRYDASLERAFARTLVQLERRQRIRKGQPVPPTLDVNVS